ncbi:hypothetical protein GGI17_004511 [Coemansia sp. S146]|nr:hypothetical protein GGI17_004511 [Coemansia sp. S146]
METINDADAHASWAAESSADGLTNAEFRYMLDELKYYKSLSSPGNNIRLSAADGTTEMLKRYATIFENVPNRQKDWHPDVRSHMLNLIDPSLYPLVYYQSWLCRQSSTSAQAPLMSDMPVECPGSLRMWREMLSDASGSDSAYYLSPILPQKADYVESAYDYDSEYDSDRSASGEQCASSSSEEESEADEQYGPYTSPNFCWLPSKFRVDENGAVTIESYINNLHPVKHAALYPIIASIFSKFLPLLERVVTDLVHPRNPGVELSLYECYKHDGQSQCQDLVVGHILNLQPKPFVAPKRPINLYKLHGRRLQAIVKLSSIELSPEAPSYSSEDWNLVGLANERIIATGIFFYDVANTIWCGLEFPEALHAKLYPQYNFEYDAMCFANGLSIEYSDSTHSVSQELGGVDIYDGQCLVFPNIHQYQMPKLTRVNATRPGHCKMLTFYYVDPSTRVPSTEIVPTQQKDWWMEDVLSSEPFRSLPLLAIDGIMNEVDYPFSLDVAKELCDDMKAEAGYLLSNVSSKIFEPYFSFETLHKIFNT